MSYLWKNQDAANFKRLLSNLIENNGLDLEDCNGYNFYFECKTGGLRDWYKSISPNLHQTYFQEHPKAISVNEQFKQIYLLDQTKKYFLNGRNYTPVEIDSINFYTILNFCDSLKFLPTSFDFHWGTSGIIGLVLLHNLKTAGEKNAEKRWNEILPYLIDAFKGGKFNDDFVRLYDSVMYESYGFQYYGALPNSPIKNLESLESRRTLIGLK